MLTQSESVLKKFCSVFVSVNVYTHTLFSDNVFNNTVFIWEVNFVHACMVSFVRACMVILTGLVAISN